MTWQDVHEFTDRYRLRPIVCGLLCVFALSLFCATHWPHPPDVEIASFRPSDKVQHFIGYLILAVLMLASLRLSRWRVWIELGRWNVQWICLLAIILPIGGLDELTQPAFGRHCSAWDLAADMIGALAAVSLFAMVDLIGLMSRRFRWSSYEPLESL